MKYLNGFLMAWGYFSSVPCIKHEWREENRGAMLNMLPLVGAFIGGISLAVWVILLKLGMGDVFTGIAVTTVYFILTGFVHLDGFMDVSDALLSRRPELSERVRILKDPGTGAFAVISLLFVILVICGSLINVTESFSVSVGTLLITGGAVSRAFAAHAVINRKPMETSQYKGSVYDDLKEKGRGALIAAALICIIVYFIFMFDFSEPEAGRNLIMAGILAGQIFITGIVSCTAGSRARKQLGGMNGDISGTMIVTGETAGAIFMAFAAGL